MKYLLILVIAFFGTSLAGAPSPDFIVDDIVRNAIINFRKQMPHGFPNYGIPPLAPFEHDFLSLNFENELISIDGNIANVFAVGANDFTIRECSYSFWTGILTVELNLINFRVQRGSYMLNDLEVKGVKGFKTKGAGDVDFSIQNVNIRANAKLGIFGGITLKDFNAVLNVGNVRSNISGLISGELPIDTINKKLEESILTTVKERRKDISAIIKKVAVPFIKKFLAENQFSIEMLMLLNSRDNLELGLIKTAK